MANHELVDYRTGEGDNAILFIHGFCGKAGETWGDFGPILVADERLKDWDVVSFGYDSSLKPDFAGVWQGDPDIATIGVQLNTLLTSRLARYRSIVLVAHSMGGLVAQRSLVDHHGLLGRLHGLFLYGTPSGGLLKSAPFRLKALRWLKRQASDMGAGSPFIEDLRSRWRAMTEGRPTFEFVVTAGSRDEFVPRSSSQDPFPVDDRHHHEVVPGDHLTMVKPTTHDDASVQVLLHHLTAATRGTPLTAAAASLERREFHAVVERLGKSPAGLDPQSLVDLALALDGLGRRDESIAVLEASALETTDAMGVLAGRLKRNWATDRQEADGRRALELYQQAYVRAAGGGDHEQAYYHGVNVAFLAEMLEGDTPRARDQARRVLEHCAAATAEERPRQRLWRHATEGEAHLLLGDPGTAIEAYGAALASGSPAPWQITSMFDQAVRLVDRLYDDEVAHDLLAAFGVREDPGRPER